MKAETQEENQHCENYGNTYHEDNAGNGRAGAIGFGYLRQHAE